MKCDKILFLVFRTKTDIYFMVLEITMCRYGMWIFIYIWNLKYLILKHFAPMRSTMMQHVYCHRIFITFSLCSLI